MAFWIRTGVGIGIGIERIVRHLFMKNLMYIEHASNLTV